MPPKSSPEARKFRSGCIDLLALFSSVDITAIWGGEDFIMICFHIYISSNEQRAGEMRNEKWNVSIGLT